MQQNATVFIRTELDADAYKAAAILEALGYAVVRDFERPIDQMAWLIDNVARRNKLTDREREVLGLVVSNGHATERIGEALQISRATVKWHMHNIMAKTNTADRENLLRYVLQLPLALRDEQQ